MNSKLLRLGGIAGICAGLFVVTFAIVSEINGILFVPDALKGGSIEGWLQNVRAHSSLARIILILPMLGFSAMLVLAMVLYQLISENSWQKNLSIASYAIGVPVVVGAFASHLSVINYLSMPVIQSVDMETHAKLFTLFSVQRWEIINSFIGPFFVIIVGHTFMAWAIHKTNQFPKWLTYWAFANGCLLLLSFLHLFVPALGIASLGAPLSMIWLVVLGVMLLKRSAME